MSLVVVGSIAVDMIVMSDIRPKKGETVIGKEIKTAFGGKGANQAVSISSLGGDVKMLGVVGDDENGKECLNNLKNKNVDINNINIEKGTTGTAIITLAEGDNSIIVIKGNNDKVDEQYILENEEIIKNASLVLIQLEIPIKAVEKVIELCKKYSKKIILNPAPAIELDEKIIDNVDYLTPNEHECRIILNDFDSDINTILKKYKNKLIITQGEKGAIFHNGTEVVTVPTLEVKAVDTTGAGDTFNGALAYAINNGDDLQSAIMFANKAGALSVTKLGAQGGMPTLDEINKLK